MKASKWLLSIMAASLLLFHAAPEPASAAMTPYESYNYNYWEEAVPAPAPYVPERSVSGADLGIGSLLEPTDMFVSSDEQLYIVDSGNNRVIHLDSHWNVKRIISEFDNNGQSDQFQKPNGLYINDEGNLYIADTEKRRVVILSQEGHLLGIIENPQSDILPEDYKFVPLKVAVDNANRVYVVAQGVYEGIMQFDVDGEFIGYVGTNKVTPDYTEFLWRLISTEAQQAQMVLFVPTEFSNLDLDSKGFVYATNIDPDSKEPVKRLNPTGADVLKRFGYFDVVGDIIFRRVVGPSKLIDVKVLENGMYSVLDSSQGKIFTYNDTGDLLYVYGGKGNQVGTFKIPAAIEYLGDKRLVLDRGRGNIVVFKPTTFGASVNEAVGLHYNGYDVEAVPLWHEVLKLNANYDIAYIGIGKSLLMDKRNKEALAYFKLGMDRKGYSVAYKRYRREIMQEHSGTFLTAVLVIAAALLAYKLTGLWRRKRMSTASHFASQSLKEGKTP
ncbi:Serine/threonine-protein kinase PknD [compost metagenome]